MDAAFTYIPADRRHALARGVDVPDRTSGAALFADVSGFTPLTEALARALGPRRGAEEMTRCLNLVYDALTAEVDCYGGSVIGFAGDAMTCWFDGDAGPRATACGLAMQRAMAPFAVAGIAVPGSGTIRLALKVALAAGPARRFLVGDPAIQTIDVLAGATLQRMAAAEHQARPGEVVLDTQALAGLAGAATVGEWRADPDTGERYAIVVSLACTVAPTPWPPLAPDLLSDDHVRAWLLPQVYAHLRGGQEAFLADLRSAASLFLRFGDIDYEADDAGDALDRRVRRALAVAARYEGTLLQVTIGDKGSYIQIAFGAPLAHDDDAVRAVAAALDLLGADAPDDAATSAPAQSPHQIGISQGRVWAGAYGGATRRTYGVMGDEVNVAARLMAAAAPGQILASRRVADAVARYYDLRPVGALAVKGKQEAIAVSAVLGRRLAAARRPAALHPHALVGRDAELARVGQVVEAALAGRGQILRIEGAAGIGKSHLAAELVERVARQGLRVAAGACQSTMRETAYLPWRQAIGALLGLPEGTEGATMTGSDSEAGRRLVETVEAFVRAANPDWLLRLPLLGDLLGLSIPDNATTAAFEPSLRRGALFDLVVELVRHLARERPLLLLIDDVHWMDEASCGLTVALGRALGAAPLVLALVHRPAQADTAILPELDALPAHQRVSLDELDSPGVAALVADRLGGAPAPLALAVVHATAQGNPFFVEELVDSLREAGRLVRDGDGRWTLSDATVTALRQAGCLVWVDGAWALAPRAALAAVDLGLPDSVEGMVLARIDRLPEAARLTLRVASVIGRTFDLDLLAAAHPLRPEATTLAAQLDVLLARDFARQDVPPPHPAYIFKHHVTHEVAYETLLFDQRRALHGAVGRTLEGMRPDAMTQLARHTYLGEDWPRALRYGVEAGRQAQRLFANHEAIEQYTRAVRAAERLPADDTIAERRDIHQQLGELFTVTSQYEPALAHLEEALVLADARDHDARARACRWHARLNELRGDFPTALTWIQRSVAALGSEETADAADALVTAGLIYTRQGDYAKAAQQAEESLRAGEKMGDLAVQARATGLLGIGALLQGHYAAAIEPLERALGLYHQTENVHGQGLVHNEIANALLLLGRWPDADYHFRRARDIFSQTGDMHYGAMAVSNLGYLMRDRGRFDEALALFDEGLRSIQIIGESPYMLSMVHLNIGHTHIRRGDLAAARRHLALGVEYLGEAQIRDFLPEAHRLLAEAALLAGAAHDAALEAHQSLDLARALAMRGEEGRTLRVLGEISGLEGELGKAEAYLTESVRMLQELGEEFEAARSQFALARLLVQHQRLEPARPALARCIGIFERLDVTVDLRAARALYSQLPAVC